MASSERLMHVQFKSCVQGGIPQKRSEDFNEASVAICDIVSWHIKL